MGHWTTAWALAEIGLDVARLNIMLLLRTAPFLFKSDLALCCSGISSATRTNIPRFRPSRPAPTIRLLWAEKHSPNGALKANHFGFVMRAKQCLRPKRPLTRNTASSLALQLRVCLISDSLGHHDSSWGSRDVGSIDRDDVGTVGVVAA